MDLIPVVSRLYFLKRLPVTLSYAQAAILLSLGLQFQELSSLEVNVHSFGLHLFLTRDGLVQAILPLFFTFQSSLELQGTQILALFNKAMRKIHGVLHKAASQQIEATLPRVKEVCGIRFTLSLQHVLILAQLLFSFTSMWLQLLWMKIWRRGQNK